MVIIPTSTSRTQRRGSQVEWDIGKHRRSMCAWPRHNGGHLQCLDYVLHSQLELWCHGHNRCRHTQCTCTRLRPVNYDKRIQHRWEAITLIFPSTSLPHLPLSISAYLHLLYIHSCSLFVDRWMIWWWSQDFADSAISCSGEGGASWRSVIVMWLEVWHVKRPPSFHPAIHGVFAGR